MLSKNELISNFGNNIKLIRKRKGMSIRDYGNFGRSKVWKIEHYEKYKNNPSLYTAYLISQKLGVTIDELIK